MNKIYKYIIDFVSNSTSFEQSLNNIKKESKATEDGVGRLADTVKTDMQNAAKSMSDFASGDISALPGIFKAGSSSAGIFTKSLTGIKAALIATGIGALIVGLGTAIAAVTKYFKGTEEGQIAFAKVVNKVKAYTEPVIQMFGRLGKSLVQLFSGDFSGAWATAKEAFTQVDDAIKNNIGNLEELNKLEEQIVKKRRIAGSEEKRLQAEISELRNKANDEQNYNSEQRKKFIADALNKEKELGKLRLDLANDELRLAELKADQGDNDIATNDELIALKDAALEIQRQTANESREMLETQQRINREIATEIKNRKDAFEKVKKEREELAKKVSLDLSIDERGMFNDVDREIKEAAENMGKDLKIPAEVTKFGEDWTAMMDASQARLEAFQGATQTGFAAIGQSIIGSLGLAEHGLEGFLGKLLETTTQLIAMMLAQSIANSISGATQSGNATGPLAVVTTPAFIATAIGGVLAAFAAIPSFSTGGIVPGMSFHGDQILARLNSGEEVLRRDDPRHTFNQTGSVQAAVRDRIIIPTARIRKGDIYISYHEAEREIRKRT